MAHKLPNTHRAAFAQTYHNPAKCTQGAASFALVYTALQSQHNNLIMT